MNNPLKKKTLDSILSGLTKVVEDLRVLQDQNRNNMDSIQVQLETLAGQHQVLESENERALRVQEKIKTLLE